MSKKSAESGARRTQRRWAERCVLIGLLVSLASPSYASVLGYSGRLTHQSGEPLDGPLDIEVRFYGSASGSDLLGALPTYPAVPLIDGIFQLELNLEGPLTHQIFGNGTQAVFIEVAAAGKTYPRQRFLAVPYALRIPVDDSTLVYGADGALTVGQIRMNQVSGLSTALNTKANTSDLTTKAPLSHIHGIGDVTGLDAALSSKASATAALTGDVSGTFGATSVDRIKGVSVTTPATGTDNGKYLQYNGSVFVLTPITPSSGGTVTSVAASPPLAVTGSPTVSPSLTLPKATSGDDGYLAAADFATFNAKQAAISQTSTLDVGTLTTSQHMGLLIKPYGTTLGTTGELRLSELAENGSDYVGFKAPDSITSPRIWTLPATNGAGGQVLGTSGGGVLTWVEQPSAPVSSVAGRTGDVMISVSDISGVIPLANGGTGATTMLAARTSMGAAASGANSDITSLVGLTTALSVAQGGTGASTAQAFSVFAGPDVGPTASAPSFRSLVAGDIPSLDVSKIASGVLPVVQGGTGLSTSPTSGQLLIGNGVGYSFATLSPGANQGVTVTNSVGAITLDTAQDIRTTAKPTFAGANIGNLQIYSLSRTLASTDTDTVDVGTVRFTSSYGNGILRVDVAFSDFDMAAASYEIPFSRSDTDSMYNVWYTLIPSVATANYSSRVALEKATNFGYGYLLLRLRGYGTGLGKVVNLTIQKSDSGGGSISESTTIATNAVPPSFSANSLITTVAGKVGIGTISPGSSLQINGAAAIGYSTATSAPTNGLAVNGNVGIGTTAPVYTLDVVGSIRATSFVSSGGANSDWGNKQIVNISSLGVGTTVPAASLSFGGAAARTLQVDRHPTANNPGNNLTINAGSATSGASNKDGGSLILASGTATGSGSSAIQFQTATSGGTGTSDNAPSTKMTILGNGNVGIGTTNPAGILHVAGATTILGSGEGGTPSTTTIRGANGTGTNIAGGDLVLAASNGTGNGGSGRLIFQTAPAGSSGTTANTLANSLTLTPTSQMILGSGEGATPGAYTLRGPAAAGTDVPGANLTIAASNGTGAGGSGSILFQTAPSASSGTGSNTLATVLALTPSGNIGMGTTAPVNKLDVSGSLGVGTYAGATSAPANSVIVSGKVGVGTTNPSTALEVAGTIRSTTGGIQFPDGTIMTTANGGTVTNQTSTTNIAFASDTGNTGSAANNISFSTKGTQRMVIANSGNIGIGNSNPQSALDITGGVAIGSYAGSTAAPSDSLIVSGNVGIGTATPQGPLHVSGSPLILGAGDQGTPVAATLRGAAASGTNKAGAALTIAASNGTGTGGSGAINFQTASAGTSGTTANSLTTRMTISPSGNIGIATTNPTNTMQFGTLIDSPTATPVTLSLGGQYSNTAGTNAKLKIYEYGSAIYGFGVSAWSFDQMAPTSAKFSWYINGAEKMRLDPTGNVSIGISSTSSKLQINGATAIGYSTATAAPTNGLAVNGNIGIGTTAPGAKLAIGGTAGMDGIMFPDGTLQTTAAVTGGGSSSPWSTNNSDVYLSSGNVGVGTSSPAQALSVNGTIQSTSGGIMFPDGSVMTTAAASTSGASSTSDLNLVADSGGAGTGNMMLSTRATERMRITNSGLVGIGSTSPNGLLDVQGYLTVASSGNVGIGSTAPTKALDVAGVIRSSTGGIMFPDGSVMTTAATGAIAGNSSTSDLNLVADSGASGTGTMIFATGTNERMRILNGGNVGIGTNSPTGLFHVSGSPMVIGAGDQGTPVAATIRGAAASGTNIPGAALTIAASNGTGSGGSGPITFETASPGTTGATANTLATRMTITPAGNVGIGTTNPSAPLSLGSTLRNTKIALYDTGTSLYGLGIASTEFRLHASGSGADFRFYDAPSGNPLMTIKGTGNVGIGTISPGSKLQINGATAIGYSTATAAPTNGLAVNGNVGIGTTTTINKLDLNGNLALGAYAGNFFAPAGGLITSGNVGIGVTAPVNQLEVAGNADFTGNVGIGTTAPSNTLQVVGSLCVNAAGGACAGSDAGTIYATTTSISSADLAEHMPTDDDSLRAGDVVVTSVNNDGQAVFAKSRRVYQDNVAGVVSTKPGVALGAKTSSSRPMALAGRVPVNVTLEGGPIGVGDYLVASSTPGKAMRAKDEFSPGVIGVALSAYDGTPIAGGDWDDGIAHEVGHQVMLLVQTNAGAQKAVSVLKARADKAEREAAQIKAKADRLEAFICSQFPNAAICMH